MNIFSLLLLVGSAQAGILPNAFRTELVLNGSWRAVETRDAAEKPPRDGWKEFAVPGLVNSSGTGAARYAWFSREIEIPADWKGRRIFLRFGGIRWDAHVFLDGKFVASRLEGFAPWEVELTDKVYLGGKYRLDVRCQDWSATFADGFRLPEKVNDDLRSAPKGKVITMIGGHFTFFGPWDDVKLLGRPRAYLDDVAIRTSIRKGELEMSGGINGNLPGSVITAEVVDGKSAALNPAVPAPGPDGTWKSMAPFPSARKWSPEDPHQYVLRLMLKGADGTVMDVREEKFGFRELWASGPDFVLNGVKRHLLATAGWPAVANESVAAIRQSLVQMKEGNNVAFRLHTQPWREMWLDVADSVGIMIVDEMALWCDGGCSYAYADRRFWDNYRVHAEGVVKRDRNHASLVMWSLENEILHCGAGRCFADTEKELGELGRFVKKLAPDRLITFESDHDPDGAADVIGLHYPHEMPEYSDYPDTCDWLAAEVVTGTGGGLMGSRGAKFRWDRKKPLYIGEYLWVPEEGNASAGSVFFGDEVYRDVGRFDVRAKAKAWEDQTLAYRRAGVSGLCPWTFVGNPLDLHSAENELYQAQKRAYEPVAAYLRDRDTRFFAGDTVTRTFDVFNDSTVEKKLGLKWRFGKLSGSRTLTLSPAGKEVVEISFKVPVASMASEAGPARHAPASLAPATAGKYTLETELAAEGRPVNWTAVPCSVEPRSKLKSPAGMRLAVYDPAGGILPALIRDGVKLRELKSAAEAGTADPGREILVIGPRAMRAEEKASLPQVGRDKGTPEGIRSFLEKGGRMLVLEQETYAGLPLGLALVDHPSTMAFPLDTGHPVLKGIADDALKFWRKGHYVARRQVRRPTEGGAKALVVTGGNNWIEQSPVVEVRLGAGTALAVQALVAEKLDTEPAARRIFGNVLEYLAELRRTPGRTGVVAGGKDAAMFLARLGVLGVAVSDPASGDALLILHGGGEAVEKAASGAEGTLSRGGTVYWHAPDPETFSKVMKRLGVEGFGIVDAQGPVILRRSDHPVLAGVAREDVAFQGASRGESWARMSDSDPGVIDRAVAPTMSSGSAIRIEAEKMAKEGTYVNVDEKTGTMNLNSGGTLTGPVTIPGDGLYVLSIIAGGTPCQGGWPLVSISVDGREVARIGLTGGEVRTYPTLADLPGGKHELKAAFINDASNATEDRNLFLDAIEIGSRPLAVGGGVEILTLPAAVAVIPAGGGRVVVDCVRWDTNEPNHARGARYAGVLLGNLGVPFVTAPPEADWVPGEDFRDTSKMTYYSVGSREARFGSGGKAAADFECLKDGRYAVVVRGRSDPAVGVYGIAEVRVDGAVIGKVEVKARANREFAVGAIPALKKGKHSVAVEFTNDFYADGADRNLFLNAVGFRRE
jgi:hypothetical protein